MSGLAGLPPLREVIARHGLRAKKQLGQHFLLDLNLTARIARAAGDLAGHTVFEVGPGPGGLTRALLETNARQVIAVELDPRAVAALDELAAAADGRLAVVEADALDLSLPALAAERGGGPPFAIVANLPYNVGTPLLLRWLDDIRAYSGLTLMFQREVAERLTAAPGAGAYGRLSVITQWLCAAERCFHVPASAFTPPPKVTSTVIRLVPPPEPVAPARKADLEAVTAAAFGQRRKMLRQSLKSLGVPVPDLLDQTKLDGSRRAEELTVEEFCALAEAARRLRDGAAD